MRRLPLFSAVVVMLALIAAACGGSDGKDTLTLGGDGILPISGNSELVVGPNRVAFGLIGEDNAPILEESGTTVHFRFFLNNELKFEQNARFTWAIPDVNGFWSADVEFDQAGQWALETILVREDEELDVRRFTFPVRETSQLPNIGDPAPAAENLTLGTEPNIKRVSTDPDPEPALYEMTIAEALQAGKPLVVTFATPAFCQTRFCGPVVDNVKEVRAAFVDQVNFIHIEPFVLDDQGQLVQNAQGVVVAEPMQQWRLQTEPWIFIVGADGRIAARFEGAASPDELRSAIEKVLS